MPSSAGGRYFVLACADAEKLVREKSERNNCRTTRKRIVVNTSPTTGPKNVTTFEDEPISFSIAGADPEGNPLSYAITSLPEHGILTGTAPKLTFRSANRARAYPIFLDRFSSVRAGGTPFSREWDTPRMSGRKRLSMM